MDPEVEGEVLVLPGTLSSCCCCCCCCWAAAVGDVLGLVPKRLVEIPREMLLCLSAKKLSLLFNPPPVEPLAMDWLTALLRILLLTMLVPSRMILLLYP
jgi:hypothetical protein